MKIKLLLLIISLGGFSVLQGQSYNPQLMTPALVSPDAASLGKFGEIPVNLSTGIPNISIPIYEIKQGKISVPVSLSYHAGGIKLEEVASSVGLGWSLNAGGVVSRVCRGLPDEYGAGIGFKAYGYKVLESENMTEPARRQYLQDVEMGVIDGEPDMFYYNFGSYSGKFFFNNAGQIVTLPQANIKITYVDQPKRGWEIIAPDGTKYIFNEVETTNTELIGGDPNQVEIETSWYLKSITDIYSNNVQFVYEEDEYGFETLGQETKKLLTNNGSVQGFTPSPVYLWNVIKGQMLSKIIFNGGEINFITASQVRNDIGRLALQKIEIKNQNTVVKEFVLNTDYFSSGVTHPQNRLKLVSLTETSGTMQGNKYLFDYNSTGLPSRLSFSQDHWGFYNGAGNQSLLGFDYNGQSYGANRKPHADYSQAAVLQKITYPTGGTTEFEFESNTYKKNNQAGYGEPTFFVGLDADNYYANPGTDLWFEEPFSVTVNDLSAEDQLAHFKIGIGESIGENPFESGYYISYFIYDENDILIFSGLKINDGNLLNLPVGNYKLKTHISLDIGGVPEIFAGFSLVKFPYIPAHYSSELAGGLRVKKIINKAAAGATPEIKTFKYNLFGEQITSGTHGVLPSYVQSMLIGVPDPYLAQTFHMYPGLTVSSNSNYPMSTTFGSHVVYKNVTSESGENSNQGKTESTFTNYEEWPDIVYCCFPFPPPGPIDYHRGLLLLETKYKKTVSGFEKVYEEENAYKFSFDEPNDPLAVTTKGIKLGRTLTSGPMPINFDFYFALEIVYYNTISEFYHLKTKKTRIYNSANPADFLETVTSYEHSNTHFEPVKVTSTNSKGEQSDVHYKYPHEMQSLITPNVYNEMVNKHIWSPVIEQSLFINSNNFLKSSKTNYNFLYNGSWGSSNSSRIIVPQTIESKVLTNNTEIISRYHSYDNNGNVTAVSEENNLEKVFIWGYNKTYPVAEVSGISHQDAMSVLSQSVLDNPASDQALRTELHKIRTNFAAARVISYTFKPLIGMTSQTDLNNRTIYYEYDDFGRLFLVRDQNNNVVKKICYNYQGQIEYCP